MKYLVVSDIHGSIESTLIIEKKFNELKCDKIIILGDILYHGPRNDLPENYNPKKVIEVLNKYNDKIIAVKGNCDAEVDEMVLKFPIYIGYYLSVNNKNYYLTHGHHINYLNPKNFNNKMIILHGHTHIIRKDFVNKDLYINIGSITLPKQNTHKCYGILEDSFKIYNLNDELILEEEE